MTTPYQIHLCGNFCLLQILCKKKLNVSLNYSEMYLYHSALIQSSVTSVLFDTVKDLFQF
jgi:hypothetical protein